MQEASEKDGVANPSACMRGEAATIWHARHCVSTDFLTVLQNFEQISACKEEDVYNGGRKSECMFPYFWQSFPVIAAAGTRAKKIAQ
ncbi:hypothetical protein pdam_00023029 [Pocillopora damicornis]|uniref:Uncharacterized protein n=1 Tax=Pocillopora damicornis TaxID=46731 RepID=A0A3M6V259_POCDA|nr:hypothetical protein pdam_00023029 [Pocillopora damicornis]